MRSCSGGQRRILLELRCAASWRRCGNSDSGHTKRNGGKRCGGALLRAVLGYGTDFLFYRQASVCTVPCGAIDRDIWRITVDRDRGRDAVRDQLAERRVGWDVSRVWTLSPPATRRADPLDS